MNNIINFILFDVAWIVTILSAANGMPYIGVLFTLLWMIFHISFVVKQRTNELILLSLAALIGYLIESTLVIFGMISYPQQTVLGAPATLWMVTLWINLAATINYSLSLLHGRYAISALAAAVAGPVAYYAGQKFGAITLDGIPALISISLVWFFAMPFLFYLSKVITRQKIFPGQLLSNGVEN